jgi:formate hydrogenlyase subunit 3/multisubunit Na+/H+ antiporter MnhD subunit
VEEATLVFLLVFLAALIFGIQYWQHRRRR